MLECWPPALKVLGFKPWVGSPRIFKIDFHHLKLSSVLIECDIKLEGVLYSVFHAEASKRA